MGKKLYVGNLPYSINDEKLMQYFSSHGQVHSAKVITDRDSGRSKGFGFVEMSSDQEATNAIESLHGKEFEGRSINVSEARESEGGRGGGGFRGGNRDGGGFNRGGGRGGFGGGGRGGGGDRDRGGNGGGRRYGSSDDN